ncbi:MAG: PIG-L deacetylase family protein [Nesterenkonia sp.]|nr:PIG-L deacetylase family protein [Nesterenkonia sp.]
MDTLRHLTPDELLSGLGVRRVLAFAAHPDDLDFGAAATMAALAERGAEITLCLLTAGDAGGFSPDEDREGVPARRAAEQREAAELLGISEVVLLDERDGFVEPTHDLIRSIVRLMRRCRPDVVVSTHPERAWERLQKAHPDHLACGEAVVRACYPAVENPFAYPELLSEEGLEAYRVPHLLLMTAPQERHNTWVSVAGYESTKVDALRRHLSQHPDPGQMERFVLEQMRASAADADRRGAQRSPHVPDDAPAEAFHLVTVNGQGTFAGF